MKEELTKNLVRPLLPFSLACLLLAVLLCVLSQEAGIERSVSAAERAQGANRPGSFDYQTGVSVCRQTKNLVPNPGFEDGGGEPWEPDHWHPGGPCPPCQYSYSSSGPGPDNQISAKIWTSSGITDCMLFTRIDEIPVEPGRYYDYSAMMKTEDFGPGDEAYLRIAFWRWQDDPSGWKYLASAYTDPVTDTGGQWVQMTGSVEAPANAERARVYTVLPRGSIGSVWFDNVFLGLSTCLEISKSADPPTATRGELLIYTITYSNTGREKATDVQIVETYDGKYVYLEHATPPPDISDNIWEIPTLSAGISGTIMPVVRVRQDTEDRASLLNGVQILSDETIEPVYTAITTPLDGDGCVIATYIPVAERVAEPGDQVNYDLVLYNVGRHDGEANLTVASSQGWAVDITPGPPYNMPSGSSKEAMASLFVPPDEPGGTVEVTLITTTLKCDPPCTETATATALVTTTVVPISLTDVIITGPTTGDVSTTYAFTASVIPVTANRPITYIWWATGQEEVITTTDAPSHTVLFTWGTTGTRTIFVTATNVLSTVTGSPHVITVTPRISKIYLPLVLCNWPPIPELYPIDNADIDGDYDVCWSAAAPPGYHYVLEESTNSACTGATPVHTGVDIHHPITDKDAGWYYYHVKVCDNSRCFDPSNCAGVGAWWEQENNEPRSDANGPLISSEDYYGYPDDVDDWFEIHLNTGGQVVVTLSNHTGTGWVQLLLYDESGNLKCRDWTRPFDLTCTVPAGCYYIRIWTPSGHNTDTPYTLHATFP